ncbi:hypothetical protein D1872_305140 [compost metagenome]
MGKFHGKNRGKKTVISRFNPGSRMGDIGDISSVDCAVWPRRNTDGGQTAIPEYGALVRDG